MDLVHQRNTEPIPWLVLAPATVVVTASAVAAVGLIAAANTALHLPQVLAGGLPLLVHITAVLAARRGVQTGGASRRDTLRQAVLGIATSMALAGVVVGVLQHGWNLAMILVYAVVCGAGPLVLAELMMFKREINEPDVSGT